MAGLEYTTEVGPHKGWMNYFFVTQGRPWKLITMDDGCELPSSLIAAQDGLRDFPWPHYNHMNFVGLITPQTAAHIISRVYNAYDIGTTHGMERQQQMARQVFGL